MLCICVYICYGGMYYSAETLSPRGFPLELQGCLVHRNAFICVYVYLAEGGCWSKLVSIHSARYT